MNIQVEKYCKSKTISCPPLQVGDPDDNKSNDADKIAVLNTPRPWNEKV
jgi:hypothetical protein